MPCGKDPLVVNKKPFDQKRIAKFSKDVLKGKVFGFAQVDIEVSEELYDKFSEMSLLFVVQEISDRDIPEEIKIYKEKTGRKTVKGTKKVTGCYEGKKDPFVHWLNTSQVNLFHGFQRKWQMPGARRIKIP